MTQLTTYPRIGHGLQEPHGVVPLALSRVGRDEVGVYRNGGRDVLLFSFLFVLRGKKQ